jgi:hypothetical protein
MWKMSMAAALTMLLLLLLLLFETKPGTFLYRRAQRLEKVDETRRRQYIAAAENVQDGILFHTVVRGSSRVSSRNRFQTPPPSF